MDLFKTFETGWGSKVFDLNNFIKFFNQQFYLQSNLHFRITKTVQLNCQSQEYIHYIPLYYIFNKFIKYCGYYIDILIIDNWLASPVAPS